LRKRKRVLKIKLHVRELCESRGITRTQLSRRADMTYNTVNALWQPEAKDIMLMTLVKVARVLHVSVDTLYTVIDED
jgi:DNA-binding Xre family transcriptional regulator